MPAPAPVPAPPIPVLSSKGRFLLASISFSIFPIVVYRFYFLMKEDMQFVVVAVVVEVVEVVEVVVVVLVVVFIIVVVVVVVVVVAFTSVDLPPS